MNTKDSERLARAGAATPGPWYVEHTSHSGAAVWGVTSMTGSMLLLARFGFARFDISNAEFVAHARTDIPDLIAEKAALLDLLRRARQSVRIHEAVLSYKTVGPMRSEDVHLVNSLLAEIDAALGEKK